MHILRKLKNDYRKQRTEPKRNEKTKNWLWDFDNDWGRAGDFVSVLVYQWFGEWVCEFLRNQKHSLIFDGFV